MAEVDFSQEEEDLEVTLESKPITQEATTKVAATLMAVGETKQKSGGVEDIVTAYNTAHEQVKTNYADVFAAKGAEEVNARTQELKAFTEEASAAELQQNEDILVSEFQRLGGVPFTDVDGWKKILRDIIPAEQIAAFSEEELSYKAVQVAAMARLHAIEDTNSTRENVGDWFGSMLLPGSWTDPEFNEAMVDGFKTLTPQDQAIVLAELIPYIVQERGGNVDKARQTLTRLFEQDGAQGISFDKSIDALWTALEFTPLGVIGSLVKPVARGLNAVKVASKVSKDTAAALNAAAIRSEKVADSMGVTQEIAATNARPVDAEVMLGPEYTDGIAGQSVQALTQQTIASANAIRLVAKEVGNKVLLPGNVFTPEQIAKGTKEFQRILKAELQNTKGVNAPEHISEIKVKVIDEERYTYEAVFSEKDKLGRPRKEHVREFSMGIDQAGSFTIKELRNNVGVDAALSPKVTMHSADHIGRTIDNVVENHELLVSTTSVTEARIRELFTKALEPISRRKKRTAGVFKSPDKKSFDKINRVLARGEELGDEYHVFSVSDLKYKGVEFEDGTLGRTYLTDPEIKTYYNMLALRDSMHMWENMLRSQRAQSRGLRAIDIGGLDWRSPVLGRGINSADLRKTFEQLHGDKWDQVRILDITTGNGINRHLTSLLEKPNLLNNKVVVRMDTSVDFAEAGVKGEAAKKSEFSYVIVRQDQLKNLPTELRAPNRRFGPTIIPGTRSVVKSVQPKIVNGIEQKDGAQEVVRYFDSRKEAQAFAAAEESRTGIKHVESVDSEVARMGDIDLSGSRNLYAGQVNEDASWGILGVKPERLGPIESLMRAATVASRELPANEMRALYEKKWLNTVRSNQLSADLGSFNSTNIKLEGLSPERRALAIKLDRLRNFLRDQANIPTESEYTWQRKMSQLADWADTFDGKGAGVVNAARKPLLSLANSDPTAKMRAITFHSLLGMFNPSQTIIQVQGASIALTMYPEYAPKAIAQAWGYNRIVSKLDDPRALDEYFTRMERAGAGKRAELEDLYKDIQENGLLQSIKSTADYDSIASGLGKMDQGVIKRTLDTGLFLYSNSEKTARVLAYSVAKSNYLKQTGKSIKQLTPSDRRAIFADTQNITLNLTRGNSAAYQRNILSVPTQFLQIQTKYWESFFTNSRALTGSQTLDVAGMHLPRKLVMGMGQLGLYGTAGVPLGNMIVNGVIDMMELQGEEIQDTPEWRVELYDRARMGIIGAFWPDIQVAQRTAIVGDLDRYVHGLISGELELWDLVFGPSKEVLWNRSAEMVRVLDAVNTMKSEKEMTEVSATEMMLLAANHLTTARNLRIAYFDMIKRNIYLDKRGITVKREFSDLEVVGKALGFSPTIIGELAALSRDDREYQEWIQDLVGRAVKDAWLISGPNSEIDINLATKRAEYLVQHLDPPDAAQFWSSFSAAISRSDTKETKALQQALDKGNTELFESMHGFFVKQDMVERVKESF